ncbi:MAG: cytochrome c oxidase assembly protein [Alphaproteobacteria bacterium]|nr:cytochrome c oxidase assembly protein [Alphaproteobacteria bacterium]
MKDRVTSGKNGRLGAVLAIVAFGMVGFAFAAVPLYRLYCQTFGLAGTPSVAEAAPGAPAAADARQVAVRFNADTDPALPWRFEPVQREMKLAVGQEAVAFYRATNLSSQPVTGTAVFNVTPLKAGPVFVKVACFCFTAQTLAPGESVDMPVSFFVDPAISDDRNLADVRTITLSYTFYVAPEVGRGEQTAARPAAARN